jgi:hypothetical protein
MTVHHPIRVTPATWSKWESRLMTGVLCVACDGGDPGEFHPRLLRISRPLGQLVLQRFGDVVLEKHALSCGSGIHASEKPID